jgi:hypothetical protein
MGRGDPLETAALMVMTTHLSADEALHTISGAARRALGFAGSGGHIEVPSATVREAIANAPASGHRHPVPRRAGPT